MAAPEDCNPDIIIPPPPPPTAPLEECPGIICCFSLSLLDLVLIIGTDKNRAKEIKFESILTEMQEF